MNKKLKEIFYKGLTWTFFGLWVLVAIISFYHCVAFCMVGNPLWIAALMSFAFEVGLALTLFSILTTDNNKTLVPWILMILLTIVQVCGNVYSVYKYMIESGSNAYTYIQGSFLHWFVNDMPQNDIMSIIAIMLGALLPIVALLMTDMVANNWKLQAKEKESENKFIADNKPVESNNEENFKSVDNKESNKESNEENKDENIWQELSAKNPIDDKMNEKDETGSSLLDNKLVTPAEDPSTILDNLDNSEKTAQDFNNINYNPTTAVISDENMATMNNGKADIDFSKLTKPIIKQYSDNIKL